MTESSHTLETVRDPRQEKERLTLELAAAIDAVDGVVRRESSVGDFVRSLWRSGSERAGSAWTSARSYVTRTVGGQQRELDDAAAPSPESSPAALGPGGTAGANGASAANAASAPNTPADQNPAAEQDPAADSAATAPAEAREEKASSGVGGGEGVEVHWGGRLVSVTVALSVASQGPPAVEVARKVREAVDEVILARDLKPGQHMINVWELD